MSHVIFHPAAAGEARDAAEYYEAQRPGLGASLQMELTTALVRIQKNPLSYAAASGPIRVCPLHRFPYSIYYEQIGERLWAAAVAHQRRRPGYWLRRRRN